VTGHRRSTPGLCGLPFDGWVCRCKHLPAPGPGWALLCAKLSPVHRLQMAPAGGVLELAVQGDHRFGAPEHTAPVATLELRPPLMPGRRGIVFHEVRPSKIA
jgi:hypothetical protein